jgi:hypothetical protein
MWYTDTRQKGQADAGAGILRGNAIFVPLGGCGIATSG